jgi:drug/metabolite transporter (DMT)-like permease
MKDDRKVWLAFGLLALAWGTSYLFIKIALRTVEPLFLVAMRLLFGWLGLLAVARLRGLSIPRDAALWKHLGVMGLINTAVPFVLITWAESGPAGVDSAVAAVLNGTVPFFSILIAGVILRSEPVTGGRLAGLVVGFAGIVLLMSGDFSGEMGAILPQLAVVAAAFFYALSSSYARLKLQGVSPVVLATGQILTADLIVWLFALTLEGPAGQSLPPATLGALLWLGLLGSCFAYILYFYILGEWGATRATLVTYLLPVVGVTAGVIFLNEPLSWQLVAGALLILSGVGLVNWRPRRAPQPA